MWDDLASWLREFGIFLLFVIIGGGAVAYGVWEMVKEPPVEIEIVKNGEMNQDEIDGELMVDVGGAVEKPGVYKLPKGARIGDVLVSAGGLSKVADRDWVAQTLNLAKEIKDQDKIFIPAIELGNKLTDKKVGAPDPQSGKINLNKASLGELDSLEGIGEVRAAAIIAGRPYMSIEELLSKAKIPESVYEKIKDSIAVY